jgi:hypothetical protein
MILVTIIATLAEKGQLNLRAYFVSFIMAIVIGALSGMIGIVIGNKD